MLILPAIQDQGTQIQHILRKIRDFVGEISQGITVVNRNVAKELGSMKNEINDLKTIINVLRKNNDDKNQNCRKAQEKVKGI